MIRFIYIFIAFYAAVILIAGCTYESKISVMDSYRKEYVTLRPPLSQYIDLDINLDKMLTGREDYLGLRVDINVPNYDPRRFGNHPAALVYFFKGGESIMDWFDKDGKLISRTRSMNQGRSGVDFDYPK